MAKHFSWHAHARTDISVVAFYLDVGGFGHHLVGNALARYYHFVEEHFFFSEFYFEVVLIFHLNDCGLSAYHAEAQRGVRAHIDGEAAVLVGGGHFSSCGHVGDIDAIERHLLFF